MDPLYSCRAVERNFARWRRSGSVGAGSGGERGRAGRASERVILARTVVVREAEQGEVLEE